MAFVPTVIYSSKSLFVCDLTFTADTDVTSGNIAHGIKGGIGGSGVVPELAYFATGGATKATAAAQRLANLAVGSIDATNIVIDKVNAVGAGSAAPLARLVVARSAKSLDASRNAIVTAAVGGQLGADS